ncbi:hypothetical protein OUZ56_005141 [Daphnia magna]|uniref:Uncharacterized protein n=1 Tax=Daphnia magna TaxID=35525 RepID=A0ABQ9YRX9_9CRUS|nr:hypothetical protein OUZ56_005141 [Daphnia magna]
MLYLKYEKTCNEKYSKPRLLNEVPRIFGGGVSVHSRISSSHHRRGESLLQFYASGLNYYIQWAMVQYLSAALQCAKKRQWKKSACGADLHSGGLM